MESLLLKTKIKHYLAKIISLMLLGSGLYKLGTSLWEIFSLTTTIQAGITIPHQEFQEFLKKFLVESIEAVVETVYGMMLFFTHAHKLKILHILIGVLVAALPWLLNERILNEAESKIPQVHLAPIVLAQATSPDQALNDYQFQLQKYREAHQEYIRAKNLYLSFQTLNAKAEAITKTKTLLIHRAETLRSYFFALRVEVLDSAGTPESNRRTLANELSAQEKFLTEYQQEIPPLTDLPQTTQASQKLEALYPQMQVLGYQALWALLLGEQQLSTTKIQSHHQKLDKLVQAAKAEEINKPQAQTWLQDIQASIFQNQSSYVSAQQTVFALQPKNSAIINNQREFTQAINELDLTKNRLLQITKFLTETINLIKYD